MASKTTYKPKVISLFSGCGGLDLGFHLEGYETVWANIKFPDGLVFYDVD